MGKSGFYFRELSFASTRTLEEIRASRSYVDLPKCSDVELLNLLARRAMRRFPSYLTRFKWEMPHG